MGKQAWSWEEFVPNLFHPQMCEKGVAPERLLGRLHLMKLATFCLDVKECGCEVKNMLCVCAFPIGSVGNTTPRHFAAEDVHRLLEDNRHIDVVSYSHGNAESVHALSSMRDFVTIHMKCVFVSYEWQGYGTDHKHKPRFHAQSARCQALLKFLKRTRFEMPDSQCNVIPVGYSLGCAVVLDAVKKIRHARVSNRKKKCKNNFKAVILFAPFLSAFSMLIRSTIFADLSTHVFAPMNNANAIKDVGTNLFVAHGTQDEVIPTQHSHELVRIYDSAVANSAYASELCIVDKANHVTLFMNSHKHYLSNRLCNFLIRVNATSSN
ncbi:hypothetical protein CYMTET_31809 [Cymbomonas tetramitiformis]|uniref:Uncharacterized protein n=1 Tax=Cymbomonas tetramitiformis TaxID=36881 RepID=A0AAE0C872_9CHLO|nr:hypothetical protein CYMTET_41428 [Cymbomonas tetramitiformis]KAK3259149.1 hypothetical protein CYMTET_31809 [Cymbomonas tetramitiformis]|eukprot:gene15591-18485_t